jgi:hypothetical protein
MIQQWLILLKFKIWKFKFFWISLFDLVEIRTSILRHISPWCWPLDHRWHGCSWGNTGSYSMAQVYPPPALTPLPWVRATPPRSTPFLAGLGCASAPLKLKTLNAFYGHFRSFAHPKPYIKNDQHKKIYNPALIVFRYQKTCLGREEPNFFTVRLHIYIADD